MIARYALPRFVELGVTQTLSFDVYVDDGTQQTPTAGTVTVYLGAERLIDAVAVTPGAPSTYSLLGTVHSTRAPADDYLEVWNLTIGGVPYTFQREGYLVRRAYHPTITDTDLTDRHSELATFAASMGGYQKYRDEANVEIQMALIDQGRRPWLVFDRSSVRRLHLLKTFELLFNDFMSVVGDGKWERLRDMYADRYHQALKGITFRYDDGETGTIDSPSQRTPAAGPVFVTAGPRHRARYSTP